MLHPNGNPFKVGDEVQKLVPLSSKVGIVIEVEGDYCTVDWGMHTTKEHFMNLDYCWE